MRVRGSLQRIKQAKLSEVECELELLMSKFVACILKELYFL